MNPYSEVWLKIKPRFVCVLLQAATHAGVRLAHLHRESPELRPLAAHVERQLAVRGDVQREPGRLVVGFAADRDAGHWLRGCIKGGYCSGRTLKHSKVSTYPGHLFAPKFTNTWRGDIVRRRARRFRIASASYDLRGSAGSGRREGEGAVRRPATVVCLLGAERAQQRGLTATRVVLELFSKIGWLTPLKLKTTATFYA